MKRVEINHPEFARRGFIVSCLRKTASHSKNAHWLIEVPRSEWIAAGLANCEKLPNGNELFVLTPKDDSLTAIRGKEQLYFCLAEENVLLLVLSKGNGEVMFCFNQDGSSHDVFEGDEHYDRFNDYEPEDEV